MVTRFFSYGGRWGDRMLELVGDFETTTTPDDVRVWASCLVDIKTGRAIHLANNIEATFEFLKKKKNSKVFYHNLKFDGEFWISFLLTKGFLHNDTKEPGTFQTLITDTGQFYSITIYFDKRKKAYHKCTIQDSLKKLPFKVAKIAKAFRLPIAKGEIDYNADRPPGYKIKLSEAKYIFKDCKIVAQALRMQFEEGLTKMTIGADSLNEFKKSITERRFEKMFPVLPKYVDDDIRRGYKGGFTYLNPTFKEKRLTGCAFDVNSLYPSCMHSPYNLPFGFPVPFNGQYDFDPLYPLYIQRLRCEFRIKPGYIPTIQLKRNRAFIPTEYLEHSNGEIVEMTLTNIDLEMFLEHYDVYNLEYTTGYKFRACTGLFDRFIDHWMEVKEKSEGGTRELAKLRLNNLYGKFATNPLSITKYPYLLDGVVKYGLNDPTFRDPVYTCVGAFITAYARQKTISSAQALYHRFIYADTDSLYLVGNDLPSNLEIHPSHLGAWKFEGNFTDSLFLRAKTYIKTVDGKPEVKCAGMPENVKKLVSYDNFEIGGVFPGKLVPKRFAGGVVLTPTDFTIR